VDQGSLARAPIERYGAECIGAPAFFDHFTTTAVPLADTISIPFDCPSTS
jgi:hypothetical protein